MRVAVLGGTGAAGRKIVSALRERGQQVIVASPSQGVNALTGHGMEEALMETDVVIDASNPPRSEYDAVMEYFESVTANALRYGTSLKHYIAISIIACDKLTDYPYMKAKLRQEELVSASQVPYTIARIAEFYEFVPTMAAVCEYRFAPVFIPPIATDDVGPLVADIALQAPKNGIVEIAGPERLRLDDFMRTELERLGDTHDVVTDNTAPFFGAPVEESTLLPDNAATALHGKITYRQWVKTQNILPPTSKLMAD